jgi:hypothetical protein
MLYISNTSGEQAPLAAWWGLAHEMRGVGLISLP